LAALLAFAMQHSSPAWPRAEILWDPTLSAALSVGRSDRFSYFTVRQFVLDDDGEPVYGVWLAVDEQVDESITVPVIPCDK
jgi:hypothetical protein